MCMAAVFRCLGWQTNNPKDMYSGHKEPTQGMDGNGPMFEADFPNWQVRFYEYDRTDVLGDLAMNGADPYYLEELLAQLVTSCLANRRPHGLSHGAAPEGPSHRAPATKPAEGRVTLGGEVRRHGADRRNEGYILTLMHEYLIHTYKGTSDIWECMGALVAVAFNAAELGNPGPNSYSVKEKVMHFRQSYADEMFAIDEEVEKKIASGEGQWGLCSDAVVDFFMTRHICRNAQRNRRAV